MACPAILATTAWLAKRGSPIGVASRRMRRIVEAGAVRLTRGPEKGTMAANGMWRALAGGVLLGALAVAGVASAQAPDTFTNLQVLPKGIAKRELGARSARRLAPRPGRPGTRETRGVLERSSGRRRIPSQKRRSR